MTADALRAARMILWRGHCSVHGRFRREAVDDVRARIPGVQVIVHPECRHEVVTAADLVGSTEYIIRTIDAAPAGSAFAVGTELNLVQRLAKRHPDKTVVFLEKTVCYCSTMNRIDLPHLVRSLESLAAGQVVNRITVDPDTARPRPRRPGPDARAALSAGELPAPARARWPRCTRLSGVRLLRRRSETPAEVDPAQPVAADAAARAGRAARAGPPRAGGRRRSAAPARSRRRRRPAARRSGGCASRATTGGPRPARACAPATSATCRPRDRGPERRLVRDIVDSRRNAGVLFLLSAVVYFVGLLIPNVQIKAAITALWLTVLILLVVDSARDRAADPQADARALPRLEASRCPG